ncbi:MAG: UDP-N-acetylglucosamine 2-epimerase (non-hydrolyzing) [Phycisphaerae bacterium]|nr:UDP-N-acetylglucosamine 2-epimerase (non-hydrolyzing) [Gemmatimonadaceae bacterium]
MMRLKATPINSTAIRTPSDRASRVAVVVGTRPEAIKMAPVVRALAGRAGITPIVISTGQHRELLAHALSEAGIVADIALDLMVPNQSPSEFAARCLDALSPVLAKEHLDAVLVQGDTTTVVAAGLAATWAHIPVGHVEAGLRSFDLQHPFPEEMHRRLLGSFATWHFAPTSRARRNLIDEGVSADRVFTTGNTIVDALKFVNLTGGYQDALLSELPPGRLITVTAHRRENHGAPLLEICEAVNTLTQLHDDLVVVWPMHPNPNVRSVLSLAFANNSRVRLIEPVGYRDMLKLLSRSTLILTDSGGIQEEAPSLSTAVLIMRTVTERPEVVTAGAGRLVGTHADVIIDETSRLLNDDVARRAMERAPNPFGDGLASERIADILELRLRGRIASGGRTADFGTRAVDIA